MSQLIKADIAVIGAGLVGLSAAVACAKLGKNVVVIDAKNTKIKLKKTWDARVYALSTNSVDWLKALETWQTIDENRVNVIAAMHLWDSANAYLALRSQDANLANLGVIIENQNLLHALWQQVDALGVTVITDLSCTFLENTQFATIIKLTDGSSVCAKLIVAADGVNSWVCKQANILLKQKDFNQTAIVGNFLAEKSHQNIARQWFSSHETLALLPLPKQMVSMVWALSTVQAVELLSLSVDELADNLQARAQNELGNLTLVGKTLSFALQQQTAAKLIAARILLMGDAAHQIHPMAGQGMNLGLRDVMQLQNMLTNSHSMQDIGEHAFLRQYERARRADIATMNALTSGLDRLFAIDNAIVKKATGWGLTQLNRQSILKKLLIQQAA